MGSWLAREEQGQRQGLLLGSGSCSFFWYPLTDPPEPTLPPGVIPLPRAARHRALQDGSLLAFLVFVHVPQGCV